MGAGAILLPLELTGWCYSRDMRSCSLRAAFFLPLSAFPIGPQKPVAIPPTEVAVRPVVQETLSCSILPGTGAALITTDGGLVRRIDLNSMEAVAETIDHVGARASFHELGDGRVVTRDSRGLAVLRKRDTFEELGRCSIGRKAKVTAYDPEGQFLAARFGGKKVVLAHFGKPPASHKDWTCESRIRDLAVSPSGSRVVALQENGFQWIQSGELSGLLPFPARYHATLVEFISEDLMAVGAAGPELQDPVTVLFVDPKSGEIKASLEAPLSSAPLGGFVSSLDFDNGSGLLSFGISSAGTVLLVDPKDCSFRWEISFGGGNPGGIGVSHAKGAARCFSHGMTILHRAAFSWETGKLLSGTKLQGYSYLCGSSDDQFTVGILDGRLMRIDSEGYHPEMRRTEYAAPLAGGLAVFSQPR